jgi:hypothetical protein
VALRHAGSEFVRGEAERGRDRGVFRRVPAAELACLAQSFELFGREFANRLEQEVARTARSRAAKDEVVIDEGGEAIECGVADGLCGVEGAASGEDGQPRELAAFGCLEEVEAPLERCPQCSLPGWQVVRPAAQQR